MGFLSQSLKPLIVERLDLPLGHGFYVVQTTPNGPADVAGLIGSGFDDAGQPASGGDIIIAINDVPVSSGAEMTAQINRNLPGDEITLPVVRNGQEERLTLVLGQWPGQ